jgi:hypothetical protein
MRNSRLPPHDTTPLTVSAELGLVTRLLKIMPNQARIACCLGFLSQLIRPVNPFWGVFLVLVADHAQGLFSQNPRTGQGPVAIQAFDLDRDGLPDLAVANFKEDSVSVLIGGGGGSFDPPRSSAVGVRPTALATADVDRDGITDLVVINSGDNTISLLRAVRSQGGVSLTEPRTVASSVGTSGLVLSDVTADGYLDLIVADRSNNLVNVLEGDGRWQASLPLWQALPVAGEPVAIAVGDINRDGRPDLAVARYDAAMVSLFLGSGRQRFANAIEYPAGPTPVSVQIADVSGDRQFDIIVANERVSDEDVDAVTVLVGNGRGVLSAPVSHSVGESPVDTAVDDINGDTIPDVLVLNSFSDTVSGLIGRAAGGFEPAVDFVVGTTPLDLAVVDLNNDGKQDIVSANFDDNNLSVLLNTSDHRVVSGDLDRDGRVTPTDAEALTAEVFDGDGDAALAAPAGYVATPGAAADVNHDARITAADLVGVMASDEQ